MSFEYCKKCKAEVQARRIIFNDKEYIWECSICKNRYYIYYSSNLKYKNNHSPELKGIIVDASKPTKMQVQSCDSGYLTSLNHSDREDGLIPSPLELTARLENNSVVDNE